MFRGQSDLTGVIIPEELVLNFYLSGSRSGLANLFRARAQIVYNLKKKKLSSAHGNFEEQNKFLESSVTVINY